MPKHMQVKEKEKKKKGGQTLFPLLSQALAHKLTHKLIPPNCNLFGDAF